VVKLDVDPTSGMGGPVAGDGVLAFNALGNSVLAWLRAGETEPHEVDIPDGMEFDGDYFDFAGKKLVVRDRFSGRLFIFDTDLERSEPTPEGPIDLGGMGGLNRWEADGDLLATINTTITGEVLKLVNFSDIDAQAVIPFAVDPPTDIDAICLDAEAGWIVVRVYETFYIYDINSPDDPPTEITRGPLEGGAGGFSEFQVSGDYVAFYDDGGDFTLLQISTGAFTQPGRNPGLHLGSLALESDRFAYFADETEDDRDAVFANRVLVGATDNLTGLVDPAGGFINGLDSNDGRVGFGETVSISPNGRFAFVAGDIVVGVDFSERLFVSIDGGDFLIVEDADDPLNALRAGHVDASDNLVVFVIPADLSDLAYIGMSVGYATLPPE